MISVSLYKLLYSLIPCLSYFIIIGNPRENKQKEQLPKILLFIIFLIYLYLVFQVTGIDSIYFWNTPTFHTINLILFDTFGEISYILNIFLFIPFGLLVPIIWPNYRYIEKTILLGSFCSLMIELFQLFCDRVTDIDDFLMNTLGCFLGYLTWKLSRYLYKTKSIKEENNQTKENIVGNSPIIWIILLLFGYLFLYQ